MEKEMFHVEFGLRTAGHEYLDLTSHHELLQLTDKAIFEVRHYLKPPSTVKNIMQITLLLLGYSDDDAKDWGKILNVLNKTGKDDLIHFVQRRASQVPMKTADKARALMQDMQLEHVCGVSSAVVAFYVWATAIISKATASKKSRS